MSSTISDIAKEAGVSIATVSRMINNSGYVKSSTRKRIEEAIKKLNYVPSAAAITLSKRETKVVGIIVPELSNPFFGEVISGATKAADGKGYAVMLCDSDENTGKEAKALALMQQQQVRGILLTPVCDNVKNNELFYTQLSEIKSHSVILDREVEGLETDGVYFDNVQMAYNATCKLISEGHTRIAVIAGNQNLRIGRERLEGYKKALKHKNIPLNKEYILYGDFTFKGSFYAVNKMLRLSEQPTAVFSCNNMMTNGLIKALVKKGKQYDYTVFSFDKVELADILDINIHYFDRDVVKMGKVAMELLIKRLEGDDSPNKKIVMSPRLK